MDDSNHEHLGSPALRLAGFQLWVHGRLFPDSHDHWDGNWLNATAHCGGHGGSVWVTGAILDTVSLFRFRSGPDGVYRATKHICLR